MADLKMRFCDAGWFVQQTIGLLGLAATGLMNRLHQNYKSE